MSFSILLSQSMTTGRNDEAYQRDPLGLVDCEVAERAFFYTRNFNIRDNFCERVGQRSGGDDSPNASQMQVCADGSISLNSLYTSYVASLDLESPEATESFGGAKMQEWGAGCDVVSNRRCFPADVTSRRRWHANRFIVENRN